MVNGPLGIGDRFREETKYHCKEKNQYARRWGKRKNFFPEKIREEGGANMKAVVDQDMCTGCELCIETCPEVFEMQNDTAVAKVDVVPPEAEETCREAAEECPVEAITIEE